MSLTHGADGGPALELLLRSELGDVADAVGTTAGPVPVRAVVERYRAVRRRRRAAGFLAAAGVLVLMAWGVSSAQFGLRTGMGEPATRPAPTGSPAPSPVQGLMDRVAALAASRDTPGYSVRPTSNTSVVDADGHVRVRSPDGSRYATVRSATGTTPAALQIRRSVDDAVLAASPINDGADPIGWLDHNLVISDPSSSAAVWQEGAPAPVAITGLASTETVVQIAGPVMLVVQGLPPTRCSQHHSDARVVELRGAAITGVREVCVQDHGHPMSPTGRWLVDSRVWFEAVDLAASDGASDAAPAASTEVSEPDVAVRWDAAGTSYQLEIDAGIPGSDERVTWVRCTVANGRCERLTGGT